MTKWYKWAVLLGFIIALAACGDKAVDTPNTISAADEKTIEFLLDSAVGDFRITSKELPSDFKNVYFGQVFHKNGVTQNILCGEFFANREGNSNIWTDFATVQTIGYEQWLGASSDQFCKHAEAIIYASNDLTPEIKQRLK